MTNTFEHISKRLTRLDSEILATFLDKYERADTDYQKAMTVADFGDILTKLYVNGYTKNDEIIYDFVINKITDNVLFELIDIKTKKIK